MNLSQAVEVMQAGNCVRREAWPNRTYIYLEGEIFKQNHLGYDTVWQPSHQDMLNNDWIEVLPER